MANIQIVKYKIRRGTDEQRKQVVLDQGELGYTTDTKRLFIGTGTLTGGSVIGSKVHPPLTNTYSLTTLNAQVGDVVVAKNKFYQLTAADYTDISSWKDVSVKIDTAYFEYDSSNTITLNDDSITPSKFNSSNINDGLIIDSGDLKVDYDTSNFEIDSNKLSIKVGGIGYNEIASSAVSGVLRGGSGSALSLKFDEDHFYIKDSDTLSLSSVPTDSVTFDSLDSSLVGDGLVYNVSNEQIDALVTSVDSSTLALSLTGNLSMKALGTSATNELPYIATDNYGRVVSHQSSIYDAVSCLSSVGGGPLSAIFNGTITQTLCGSIPDLPLTTFTVLSSNASGTTALTLSSAGFIMFEGGGVSRQDGKYISRFAIPIFSY